MRQRRDQLLAEVVRVLAGWDPIGLSSHVPRADLEDEYRGYARGVTDMLLRGVEAGRLVDHLRGLCESEMGVAADEARETHELLALRGGLVA